MLAIFGDFAFTELLLVAAAALMVFGRRLPEVAMRAAAHLTRLRRSVTQMWREAGIEEELRKVRRDVEREMPDVSNPRKLVRDMGRDYLEQVEQIEPAAEPEAAAEEAASTPAPDQREEATEDPDADRESA